MAAWHEGAFDNSWDKPCNDTRPFRRAYRAAVSYTDTNVGKVRQDTIAHECSPTWQQVAPPCSKLVRHRMFRIPMFIAAHSSIETHINFIG